MAILPISNVINVTITQTPQGLTERNINNVALFTTETPSNVDEFRTYVSASQVATDYGTNSVTAQMANAIFAQTPNIRTGDGQLIILPLQSSVSATQGSFVTDDISTNLASLIAVTDGDIRVTVDGTNVDLTDLDFTSATTLADIATILQRQLENVIVTATETAITFKSKKVGADSDLVVAQLPAGAGTDLSGAGFLNVSAGTTTSGVNSSGETIAQAITRTNGSVFYASVITNLEMEDSIIDALATFIQARDLIFTHHFSSKADIAGIITDISSASNTKTRSLLYTESPQEANLFKSAYVGRAFSVNTNGTDTAQTMNLKSLATITPDNGINQTNWTNAETAGVDLYVSYDGVASVVSTGGNDYFDNVYSDLALKFALEAAGFNYLRQTNTKVPQTESGLNGLKSAYGVVMERFVNNGFVAAGAWTSSETFGNPEIFKENILDRGYYIYSIPITQQSASEREAREAPLIQIAVKRSGAIHSSDVLVVVND